MREVLCIKTIWEGGEKSDMATNLNQISNKAGFTINEAAEYTGVGRNTMRQIIAWGKLPVLKVGRKVIIRRDMLDRFMEVNQGRNLRDEADVQAVSFGMMSQG